MSTEQGDDIMLLKNPVEDSMKAEKEFIGMNHENAANILKDDDNHVEDAIKAEKDFIGINHENDVGLPKEYENHVEDAIIAEKELICMNQNSDTDLAKENGLYDINPYTVDIHDQLVKMVVELTFQTEYLKSHFEDLKNFHSDSGGSYQEKKAIMQDGTAHEDVKVLYEKIESLNRELLEERQTRGAAEEALKHLRAVYSEADANAQELSAKLAEGCTLFF